MRSARTRGSAGGTASLTSHPRDAELRNPALYRLIEADG